MVGSNSRPHALLARLGCKFRLSSEALTIKHVLSAPDSLHTVPAHHEGDPVQYCRSALPGRWPHYARGRCRCLHLSVHKVAYTRVRYTRHMATRATQERCYQRCSRASCQERRFGLRTTTIALKHPSSPIVMTRHVLPPVQCLCVSTHPPRMTEQTPARQADAPSNAVEAAVCHMHALLSKRRRLEPGAVAEWWVHARSCGAAHGLHFDVDETRLRRGKRAYSLRHPVRSSRLGSELVRPHEQRLATGGAPHKVRAVVCSGQGSPVDPPLALPSGSTARRGGLPRAQALSSVLFLCGAAAGAAWGPTFVIEQTPASPPGARAWAAPAAANCLVAFPGSFLHGVLPGAPRAWLACRLRARTTLRACSERAPAPGHLHPPVCSAASCPGSARANAACWFVGLYCPALFML
jgi:hypothetical protein